MDDFSAYMLEILDDEIQQIKKAILKRYPNYDLSLVIPLKDRIVKQYGESVSDSTNMKTTFRTNKGYATVKIPIKPVKDGVIVNVDGRIFWEDIPYGLCILKDLAQMLNVNTPGIDKMTEWH